MVYENVFAMDEFAFGRAVARVAMTIFEPIHQIPDFPNVSLCSFAKTHAIPRATHAQMRQKHRASTLSQRMAPRKRALAQHRNSASRSVVLIANVSATLASLIHSQMRIAPDGDDNARFA